MTTKEPIEARLLQAFRRATPLFQKIALELLEDHPDTNEDSTGDVISLSDWRTKNDETVTR